MGSNVYGYRVIIVQTWGQMYTDIRPDRAVRVSTIKPCVDSSYGVCNQRLKLDYSYQVP